MSRNGNTFHALNNVELSP